MPDEEMPPRLPVDPASAIAAVQQRFDRLSLPPWPVFGLDDTDARGWLCGVGENENGIVSVRIDYRPPGHAERLIVQTQHGHGAPPELSGLLAQLDTNDDSGEPLDLGAGAGGATPPPALDATMMVDDELVAGVFGHDGNRSVWCARTQDVDIVVAAREVALDRIRLRWVTDLEQLKQERRRVIRSFLDTAH